MRLRVVLALCTFITIQGAAQSQRVQRVDWPAVERETLEHFQAIVRLDTSNPPGNETRVAEYLSKVLDANGIPVQVFALEPARANLVARLKGNGTRRPLLLMGHTDVVSVEPAKWQHGPFSADRAGGYVYGRGTRDDKSSVATALMVMLTLKRSGIALDRDVIFLAEAGEEGTTRPGIDFIVSQHFASIDAEFCLAEGGNVRRENGKVRYASVGALEKVPRTIELIARGPSAHASVPRLSNAVARLSRAITALSEWQAPIRLNEITSEQFRRMASVAPPEQARHLEAVLSGNSEEIARATRYLQEHLPEYAALLRTSVSPTIVEGGLRYNVVPSEAKATLDVRLLPDENPDVLLNTLRQVVNDPVVEVTFARRDGEQRPPGGTSINTEAFRAIEQAVTQQYGTITIPTMSTGASDKAQVRSKGVQCYGVGPGNDAEDAPKGFGSHADQERIRERDLHDFVRFYWDVVMRLAASRPS